jgi:hypothetical protein
MPDDLPQSKKLGWQSSIRNTKTILTCGRRLRRGETPPRRLAAHVNVLFPPEESDHLYRVAKETGLTLSEVIRKAVAQFSAQQSTAAARRRA